MKRHFQSWLNRIVGMVIPARPTRLTSCKPLLECLEDRTVPSLIASQILPILLGGGGGGVPFAPTNTTVVVIAPGLSANAQTGQTITLEANVGGGGLGFPNGGTVDFNLGIFGTVDNVAVVNGVAQTTFIIPVGVAAEQTYTVTAHYSGNSVFMGSTSGGTTDGTLYFCQAGASTLLGTTVGSFAVLGGSAVTNSGATFIAGDVGVSPGSAITGLAALPNPPAPGSVEGTIHSNDAVAVLAQSQLTTAFTTIQSETGGFTNLTGRDLGGLTLTPGRYHFDNAAQLTGTLTLNDLGNPDARFDFQIGSTLTTASGSRILIINGGADNVYWEVGSSANLGTSTVFAGNILAQTSITLGSTASIGCGRALARTGAVTLLDNFIDPAPAPLSTNSSSVDAGKAPTVAVAASASTLLASGTKVNLSVRGADLAGANTLIYTWSLLQKPPGVAAPNFSANGTNAARNITATFRNAGTYTFEATIRNWNGLSTTSLVTVTVNQTITRIEVTSDAAMVQQRTVQQFAAIAYDQFGDELQIQPIFQWSIANGIGTISATGQYRTPTRQIGNVIIQASVGSIRGVETTRVV